MEELLIAFGAVLAALALIGGVTWIFRKSEQRPGLAAKAAKLEAENADLKIQNTNQTALVRSIHQRAAESRSVADPVLTVVADEIERSMEVVTKFRAPPA